LHAVVGVDNYPGLGVAVGDGHASALVTRAAVWLKSIDHPTTRREKRIQHNGAVDLAFSSAVFGDIGDPQSIWLRPGEHALDEILRGGSLVAGPAWYFNVKAHPAITVQDGDKVVELTAREVEGVEREQWWELAVAAYPPYAEYQTKTARLIPVFVLE
jgi:F420H(2)-dependent quinone reductase